MTVDSLVNAYVEAFSDSGERTVPMATTDAEEVIRGQLVEDTGRHLLDSGGAYGRNWEQNQDNPPWEQPEWNVDDSFVTHNVYHYLEQRATRDTGAVALEVGLFAYGLHGPAKSDSWLSTMKQYAELVGRPHGVDVLTDCGLPRDLAEQAIYAVDDYTDSPMSWNTYNGEWHGLSQVLQGVNFGGPYSEYVMVQVHGGCDVRGGYTAPRVYRAGYGTLIPGELSYYCPRCEWSNAESVIGYEDPALVWLRTADGFELEDALDEKEYDAPKEAQEYALEQSHDAQHVDGAVFHLCGDGEIGHVRF